MSRKISSGTSITFSWWKACPYKPSSPRHSPWSAVTTTVVGRAPAAKQASRSAPCSASSSRRLRAEHGRRRPGTGAPCSPPAHGSRPRGNTGAEGRRTRRDIIHVRGSGCGAGRRRTTGQSSCRSPSETTRGRRFCHLLPLTATPCRNGVAPRVGFEPTTYRLTAGRSTVELSGIDAPYGSVFFPRNRYGDAPA